VYSGVVWVLLSSYSLLYLFFTLRSVPYFIRFSVPLDDLFFFLFLSLLDTDDCMIIKPSIAQPDHDRKIPHGAKYKNGGVTSPLHCHRVVVQQRQVPVLTHQCR
jgi:hypothetical protein